MAAQKTALIVGASGLVGGYLLQMLLQSNHYSKIIAIGRRALPIQDTKLEQRIVDLKNLGTSSDLQADDVFCCLGTTMKKAGSKEKFYEVDFTYVVELAKITSQKPNAQFLVVSAMGADKNSTFFYNRVKGEMEEAVSKLPFAAVHIFRPSLLLGNRPETRLGEKIGEVLMSGLKFAMVGPLRKYRAVPAQAVAKAMLQNAITGSRGVSIHESDEIARYQSPA